MGLINKRYKDIFAQYIYKDEKTPLSIGTLAVCAFCFLLLIIATFSEISFPFVELDFNNLSGEIFSVKNVSYSPRIPVMMFIIYLLGREFSILVFLGYLITGIFIWPLFVYGGGFAYAKNYLFGYFLGFIFAIFITGGLFKIDQSVKTKIIAGTLGVLSIHLSGFLYCAVLAVFRIIDFNMIIPIAHTTSGSKIFYDLFFTLILFFIGRYIKSVFWVCMKPKPDKNKRYREKITPEDYDLR